MLNRWEASTDADDFRRIALGLKGAEEGSHVASTDFRVGGKIFVTHPVKVFYEIVILPLHARIANRVKDIEHIDGIDTPETTNYNPFGDPARHEKAVGGVHIRATL